MIAATVAIAVVAILIVRKKRIAHDSEAHAQSEGSHHARATEGAATDLDTRTSEALAEESARAKEAVARQEAALQNAKDELKAAATDSDAQHTANTALDDIEKECRTLADVLASKTAELAARETAMAQLKKKLQDAEDEIDELDDEASSNKKKLNEEKTRHSETRAQLEESQKNVSLLKESIEDKDAEIAEKEAELAEKGEAIDFVNEILKAKDADDKDSKEIDRHMNAIYDTFDDSIRPTLKELRVWDNAKADEWENKVWQWCNLQRKTWLQGKKVVAFVGEFSAGKTSIVNRILSKDNDNAPKLPVSSKATTAIATYISYGSDFLPQYTTPEGKLKNISKETFEKVTKDILRKVDVSSVISHFVMSYRNDNLRDLSILDTPGFNSNDSEDARRTAEAIKEADALFWVFDANTGEINQTSIDTIRTHLKGLPLFIVINKADTKSPKALKELEIHIRRTVEKNDILVNGYVQFSHTAPVGSLLKLIESIPAGNNKDENIAELQGILSGTKTKLQKEYDETRRKLKGMERKNEEAMYDLERKLKDIEEECINISNIPEYKEKLFGSDYFKITKEQWNDFIGSLEMIDSLKAQIDTLSNVISECSKGIQDFKNELEDKKEALAGITGAANKFGKALEDYRKATGAPHIAPGPATDTDLPHNAPQSEAPQQPQRNIKEQNEDAFASDIAAKMAKGRQLFESDIRNIAKKYHISGRRALAIAKELEQGWGSK